MNVLSHLRKGFWWLAATLIPLAFTFLLVHLKATSAIAGMIFLVLVVWTATRAGMRLSLFTAVLCALVFDYFFLPPFRSMRIAGAPEWVAMVCFIASCVVVGRVAEQARRQALQAERRSEDVERLYSLSQEMMLHEDAAGLVRDLPALIERIFLVQEVVLYVRDEDQFHSTRSEVAEGFQDTLRSMMETHNPSLTLPGQYTVMALMLGLRPVGALAWRPALLSHEVATAVSAQVAIALTRAVAMEASARLEAARAGERLRTALIDSLTHELRTPLTSIKAAATTLMQGEGLDDASRLDLATIVDEEASRLDALIGRAVEMAEIDANFVQVRSVPQHPRALLEQAVEESRSLLATHRVVVVAEDSDSIAWFDPHLLGRVLRHLLENAARYSPPGSRITLRTLRTPDRLEFRVEDNGVGIDAIDLPLIFEKFYRGKKGPKLAKGSGMGLAITRAIVTAHGGSIDVTSQPGQGTTFRFWVPLIEKEPSAS
jgi:two-component system sensor histidine kinase KdpD